MRALADWIETECKLRVWQRKLVDFEKGMDGEIDEAEKEILQQLERQEKEAHDFVFTLRSYADFVETRHERA